MVERLKLTSKALIVSYADDSCLTYLISIFSGVPQPSTKRSKDRKKKKKLTSSIQSGTSTIAYDAQRTTIQETKPEEIVQTPTGMLNTFSNFRNVYF